MTQKLHSSCFYLYFVFINFLGLKYELKFEKKKLPCRIQIYNKFPFTECNSD